MNQDEYWQAVITRNRNYDGKFVYGVISTKIYCHPSCSSRKPRRDKVIFFSQIIAVENQGFRACKRCFSENKLEKSHLKLIQQICDFINDGGLGGYRWGIERKKRLLNKEQGTGNRG